ncbi:MAG: hypothetical protein LBL42_03990 [Tannerella sp.]|jgi:hypothetical protein|nr:hypothetical protein [Tannerella sp.]
MSTVLTVVRYLGTCIQLVGVVVLAVPAIGGGVTNTHLTVGLSLIIFGYLAHIVLNKILKS